MASKREPDEGIYMDKAALAFLRGWPGLAAFDQETYERLYAARVIATPWKEIGTRKWARSEGGCVLTNLGVPLKALVDDQSINFFTAPMVLGLWPVEILAMRRDDCTNYLALFGLDWNDAAVRRYISAGLNASEVHGLNGKVVDPSESRATLTLSCDSSGAIAELEKVSLTVAMAGLEVAVAELTETIKSGSNFHGE